MISNKNLFLYACVAKRSTIVADFSGEPWLAEVAQKCIEKTPLHHLMFSHTEKKRTYTFLIEDPFAYFAIHDEDLDRLEGLRLLSRIKQAFQEKIGSGSIKDSDNLAARCFQAQMDQVFGETLVPDPAPVDLPAAAAMESLVEKPNEGLKKKKKASTEMGNESGKANHANVDVIDSHGSIDFPVHMHKNAPILFPGSDRQRAKQVWKRHVWVVLMLDFFVCSILFGIWLWVCRGLECIDD